MPESPALTFCCAVLLGEVLFGEVFFCDELACDASLTDIMLSIEFSNVLSIDKLTKLAPFRDVNYTPVAVKQHLLYNGHHD